MINPIKANQIKINNSVEGTKKQDNKPKSGSNSYIVNLNLWLIQKPWKIIFLNSVLYIILNKTPSVYCDGIADYIPQIILDIAWGITPSNIEKVAENFELETISIPYITPILETIADTLLNCPEDADSETTSSSNDSESEPFLPLEKTEFVNSIRNLSPKNQAYQLRNYWFDYLQRIISISEEISIKETVTSLLSDETFHELWLLPSTSNTTTNTIQNTELSNWFLGANKEDILDPTLDEKTRTILTHLNTQMCIFNLSQSGLFNLDSTLNDERMYNYLFNEAQQEDK